MARSVHDLPATGYGAVAINWSDLSGHLVDVGLVASGGSAYLRRIVLHGATSNANSVFNIGENDTEDGLGAGPDLTVAWETNPAGITLQEVGASDSVTLGGPNAPANTPGDPAEAYFWSYGAADKAALVTWLSSYAGGAVTLTLDDGVPVNVDHTVTASPANWTFDLPEASATKTAPPPAALALSDWSLPAGRTQEAAALITAGDELYRAGVEGSLDDGELTLDNAEITINRIRSVGSGAQLTLNKSGADSWDSILEGTTPPYADFQLTYSTVTSRVRRAMMLTLNKSGADSWDSILEGTTPPYADFPRRQLHLQYGDQSGEIIVLDIDDLDDAGGSSFARFTVPSADQGALDGIASGDAFILAFTRAASDPVAHTATASPASWTFDLPEASATRTGPDPVAHTVTASPASWTFDLPEASATKTGPVATLTLSDWSLPAGRTQEAAALITAGDELYRAGVEGSLDDGELTLDNAEITINRIRSVGFGAQLTLNQSGAIDSWSSILEGTMPPYADVQIHLQYGDQPGEIIVLDIDDLDDAGGSFARFDIPSADQGALDGIASGDAFILAVTRAASGDPVAHTATASPSRWTFDLPEASTARSGAHTANASPANWAFDLPEASATRTGLAYTATASPASWAFDLPSAGAIRPADRARIAARALEGADEIHALEITHPGLTAPVRIVNDTADHTVEGNTFLACSFEPQLPQEVDGQVRRASIRVDNIGRKLMEWIELSEGGKGAYMRILALIPPGQGEVTSEISYDVTMGVVISDITHQSVTVEVAEDSLVGRPGILLRHDPGLSPGLF